MEQTMLDKRLNNVYKGKEWKNLEYWANKKLILNVCGNVIALFGSGKIW